MTDTHMTHAVPEPTTVPVRPDHVPAKFWDAQAGVIRVDALLKSYAELEKRLGEGQPDPATPDGQARLRNLLGVPATPDDYVIDLSTNVLETDPEVNARLHALGFTPTQVQAVYDMAAERLVPLIRDLAAQLMAEAEVEKLERAFGGREKWVATARQLMAFGKKHVPADVLATLSSSAEGVMMLHRMMMAATQPRGRAPGVPVADHDLKTLQAMMRDPKYWRDHDPAIVAKVSAGFARLYG